MKQKPGYNYHGRPRSSRMAFDYELETLKTTPTAKQRKYLWFLTKTLAEHEVVVPPCAFPLCSRMDYADRIGELVKLCNDNGIPVGGNRKKFDRLAIVEADGSVRERLVEREENDEDA